MQREPEFITVIKSIVFVAIYDAMVSLAAALIVTPPHKSTGLYLIVFFIGIQAIKAVSGLYRFIQRWVMYFISYKKHLTRRWEKLFYDNDFPVQRNFYLDSSEYFEDLIGSDACTREQHAVATYTAGLVDGVKSQRPLTEGLFYSLSVNDAVVKYTSDNRPRD